MLRHGGMRESVTCLFNKSYRDEKTLKLFYGYTQINHFIPSEALLTIKYLMVIILKILCSNC